MRRNELWIVTCTVLWLSACSTLPRPVPPRPVEPDHQNAARRAAEVRTRWVGVTELWTKSCPAANAPGWSVRPLFPMQGLDPKVRRSARRANLHRYCVYEFKGTAPDPRKLELPRAISDRLRSVEPDKVVLSGMASLEELTWGPFSQRFAEQVQAVGNLPVNNTARVRLAVLDTQPTGQGIPQLPADPNDRPRSRHGYTLTHIAGKLAGTLAQPCGNPSEPCAVKVAPRLALPLVSVNPEVRDTVRGGYRGTFTDLSQAIWAEIDAWQQIQPPENRPKLVLNLSVGWDGEKYGGWAEDLTGTPEIKAVYDALKAAADLGILVIAAAGNERGGPNPTQQPLLPAGWEKPYRLSQQNGWIWKDIGQPIVYAASGVDGLGRQLVNTRRKGEAPRVAYADHVVVPDLYAPSQRTATLTGTSVASAVISTIAAVVWSYRPNLTPVGVMNILDGSGMNPMGRDHNFAPSVPAPVRQITLCRAVAKAQDWPGTPHTPPTCATPLPEPDPIDLSAFTGNTAGWTGASTSFRPHPDPQDQPLAGPQPGVDPCPNCVIDPPQPIPELAPNTIALAANTSHLLSQNTLNTDDTYTLLIELPPYGGGVLQSATLGIFAFDSTGTRVADPVSGSSIDTTTLGNALKVSFPKPQLQGASSFQAALSFTLDPDGVAGGDNLSIVSPLLIDTPE